jgi:hypothetical protein
VSGVGVLGLGSGGTANTVAVEGFNQSSGTNGHGVVGQSVTGYGVLGYSTGGSASMSGISTNANIPAFAGGNSVAGGLAASFNGTVFVNGAFVVADMAQKHGLLKHPDGSHRLMYTVEAPESWAEDFGTGTLASGKADVKLDADFAALVHTEDYHVFLTPYGNTNGLHVTKRDATGFTVEEHNGGKNSLTFSWRVVAKPKTEKKIERLGKFTVPNVPLPNVSQLPKPPEQGKKP